MTEQAATLSQLTVGDIERQLGLQLHAPAGRALAEVRDQPVHGGRIDARAVTRGDVFVALQGSRAHGASYAAQAAGAGAVVLLAGNDTSGDLLSDASVHLPVLHDREHGGVEALGRLGRLWRQHCGFTVVGITGSTGKTSTKDILASLATGRLRTVASHANHNNEIGVPLTLLSAPAATELVICEMGMRGLGQIAYLCDIAEPDVGIVTNAGSAHLELLGSLENIVRAKAEIIAGVRPGGTAVVPAWQPELVEAAGARPARVLSFGMAPAAADCVVEHVDRTPHGIRGALRWDSGAHAGTIGGSGLHGDGTAAGLRGGGHGLHEFELPVHGAHQALNLAAAVCAYEGVCGSLDGLSDAFSSVRLTSGRGDRHPLPGGGVLIDDAYNANPESMRAAIAELVTTPADRRVAVLGSMAELGHGAERFHRELGEIAAGAAIDQLVVVATTPEARLVADAYEQRTGTQPLTVTTVDEALDRRDEWLRSGDAVLVKASNSVGLGRLAQALVERVGAASSSSSAGAAQ